MSQDTITSRRAQARLSGEAGFWIVIVGDMAVFTLFFAVFAYYWQLSPEVFATSQAHLTKAIGFVNTVLLLVGSWLVVRSVRLLNERERGASSLFLLGGALTGVIFLINKVIEWSALSQLGFGPNANDYFMLFYVFTAVHGFHVLIATGALFYFVGRLRNKYHPGPEVESLECAGLFWHMVDLLWVVLFSLFYLIG